MAVEEKKFLGEAAVERLIANTREEFAAADETTLAAAKKHAEDLGTNYDAAGVAVTKVQEHNNNTNAHSDIRNAIGVLEDQKVSVEYVGNALPVSGIKKSVIYIAAIDADEYKAYLFIATTDSDAPSEDGEEGVFNSSDGYWMPITDTNDITSVNGKTGIVVLGASDVGADPEGTAAAKVQELADGQVALNTEHIGAMDNLETTAKSDLVAALNEVRNAVSAGGTAAAITMEEKTTGLSDGVLKAYVFKQGENTVGTINIPKDMVVQSGEVVVNPEGQAAGTYIKLVLANATNDVIYVNVGTLVDIYKAKANAAQIQTAIDSTTREISATIVAGSVTATELGTNAVTTSKIADNNVTKTKLSAEVQTSLGKADVAEGNAKTYADGLNTAMDNRVKDVEAALADGGSVDVDIADAKKAGTDAAAAVTTLENGKVADLRTDVDALKSVNYVEITADEIDAMFAS